VGSSFNKEERGSRDPERKELGKDLTLLTGVIYGRVLTILSPRPFTFPLSQPRLPNLNTIPTYISINESNALLRLLVSTERAVVGAALLLFFYYMALTV
jgi:hypothetical protein